MLVSQHMSLLCSFAFLLVFLKARRMERNKSYEEDRDIKGSKEDRTGRKSDEESSGHSEIRTIVVFWLLVGSAADNCVFFLSVQCPSFLY